MARYAYRDFDLQIARDGDAYRACVIDSPGGRTGGQPFTPPPAYGGPHRVTGARDLDAAVHHATQVDDGSAFGAKLAAALFAGDVRTAYNRSIGDVLARGAGLRIRLRLIDCPELADVPWEFLRDPGDNRFLCLSDRTPLVRFLPVLEPVRPLAVDGPLRILAVIANPRGDLDVEAEWAGLSAAIAGPGARGAIRIDRLAPPTVATLREWLHATDYHVLHFIGHGQFNTAGARGELLFETDQRRADPVPAAKLATFLHTHTSLRLAVLNACEGGRTNTTNPFAGTAQTLIHEGVPAVVAMQFAISDLAAIDFAKAFYGALTSGDALDAATTHGRQGIFAGNDTEWATPVLYTHASDTVIFTVAGGWPGTPAAGPPVSRVVAWGADEHHQCDVPAGLGEVRAVAAGDYHSLALTGTGVIGWGSDVYGQATSRSDLASASAIAAGGRHSLALVSGEIVAWGSNSSRQCDVPPRLGPCTAIAAGGAHGLAIAAGGEVAAWGSAQHGQTGVPPDLTGVVAIAAGRHHSLALTGGGDVVAWGAGCGVPPGLGRVTAIAAGHDHCVAVTEDGTVVTWPVRGDREPVRTTLASRAHLVAAGSGFTVAFNGGGVEQWSEAPRLPHDFAVPPLANMVGLAAGAAHVVALTGAAG